MPRLFAFLLLTKGLDAFPMQTRKSVLLPWKSDAELGFCIETVDEENGLLGFEIGVNDMGDDCSTKGDGDLLQFSFPRNAPGGSLASQSWPAAMASSILIQSPEFRKFCNGKDLLELGAGVGLAGFAAAAHCSGCTMTDNDEESVGHLKTAIELNKEHLQATMSAKKMDWRNDHGDAEPFDIIFGSDIAYYYYLLRPIMDTSRAFMKESGSLLMFVGQANRESQSELYKNFRDGCYNQLTDEHEPAWPGETKLLLFNLRTSDWADDLSEINPKRNGILPISVILHHPKGLSGVSMFKDFEYAATDDDDDNIMKSF